MQGEQVMVGKLRGSNDRPVPGYGPPDDEGGPGWGVDTDAQPGGVSEPLAGR